MDRNRLNPYIPGFRKLSGATMILLLILSSIGIVASGKEVVIHNNGDYTVTYKDKLLPTKPHLTVTIEGAPRGSKMIVYSYILTPTGYKYYKSSWGTGKISMEVAGAIEEIARGLRSLGWKGGSEGLSLLLLILYAEETRKGVVIESKMLNVPIIPGQTKDKDIAVAIQRNSLTEMTMEKGKSGVSVEEIGTGEAPGVIPMLCIGHYPLQTCYRWTLNYTLHEAHAGVPLQITRVNGTAAQATEYVDHIILIELKRGVVDYIKLNAAFAIGQGSVTLTLGSAGPTFTKQIDGNINKETLMYLDCTIYNTYVTNKQSICVYGDNNLYAQTFYLLADVMTGIVANVGVSVYNLERAYVSWGYIPGWDVVGNGTITWMIPVSDGAGKLLPSYYVDDWLGDGQGLDRVTDEIMKTSEPIQMRGYRSLLSIPSTLIQGEVQYSPKMALGVDVGALLLALALGSGASLPAWLIAILPTLVVGLEYGSQTTTTQYTVYIYRAYSPNPNHTYYPVMYKAELPYQEFVSNDIYEVPRSLIQP